MKRLRQTVVSWSLCALLSSSCLTPPAKQAPPTETVASASATTSVVAEAGKPEVDINTCCRLPETDEGLPGAGPIQRADWFRKIWTGRRYGWAQRVNQDQGAVVFLGDSITEGWGDDMGKSFPELRVANRGIGGDTTRGVLIRLKADVLALHPKAVVLLIGTNDISNAAEPETIASNVNLILLALQAENPAIPVILCEVFPSSAEKNRPKEKIQRLNQMYADLAKGYPQVTLVHTWAIFANEQGDARESEFPDLLHPNQQGYLKWADALRPALPNKP